MGSYIRMESSKKKKIYFRRDSGLITFLCDAEEEKFKRVVIVPADSCRSFTESKSNCVWRIFHKELETEFTSKDEIDQLVLPSFNIEVEDSALAYMQGIEASMTMI